LGVRREGKRDRVGFFDRLRRMEERDTHPLDTALPLATVRERVRNSDQEGAPYAQATEIADQPGSHRLLPLRLPLRASRLPVRRGSPDRPLFRTSPRLDRGPPAGAGPGLCHRDLRLRRHAEPQPRSIAYRSGTCRVLVDARGDRALAPPVRRDRAVSALPSRR